MCFALRIRLKWLASDDCLINLSKIIKWLKIRVLLLFSMIYPFPSLINPMWYTMLFFGELCRSEFEFNYVFLSCAYLMSSSNPFAVRTFSVISIQLFFTLSPVIRSHYNSSLITFARSFFGYFYRLFLHILWPFGVYYRLTFTLGFLAAGLFSCFIFCLWC